jgi:hypothetical protein
MPQIQAIKKRISQTPGEESKASKYGALGGAAVGGLLGLKAGSPVAGAAAGSSLGGLVGGMFGEPTPGTRSEQFEIQPMETSGDNAMARKLASARQDRLALLRQAEASLPQLPPELREQYADTIVRATMEEEKRRAMGLGSK